MAPSIEETRQLSVVKKRLAENPMACLKEKAATMEKREFGRKSTIISASKQI